MDNRKIMAVCLSTRQPAYATAVWLDQHLGILDYQQLPPQRSKLDAVLLPHLHKAQEDGYHTIIDDASQRISSQFGVPFRLNALDNNGRPMLISSLELFRELEYQSAISYPKGLKGSFAVPESIVDEDNDPRGNTIFRIDWPNITTHHVLTLLCVQATVYNQVGSANYLSSMMGDISLNKNSSQYSPLNAVLSDYDRRIFESISSSEMNGKKGVL